MTTAEIIIVAFGLCFLGLFTVLAVRKHRKNQAEPLPKEEYISPSDRAYMREHNLTPDPSQMYRYKPTPSKATLAKSASGSVSTATPGQTTYTIPSRQDDGPDLLTTMILMDALTSKSDITYGNVTWKDDTPTINVVSTPDPTPSYSSSSESSSSSYSSSYSSSSDSSSYSSSSSDSSYSSSSD